MAGLASISQVSLEMDRHTFIFRQVLSHDVPFIACACIPPFGMSQSIRQAGRGIITATYMVYVRNAAFPCLTYGPRTAQQNSEDTDGNPDGRGLFGRLRPVFRCHLPIQPVSGP